MVLFILGRFPRTGSPAARNGWKGRAGRFTNPIPISAFWANPGAYNSRSSHSPTTALTARPSSLWTRRNADDVETHLLRLARARGTRRGAGAPRRPETRVHGRLVGVRGVEPVLLHGQ